ncbi:MAG TPA: hypothetical protein VJ787_07190 [Thermoleophilia bacterium]|nr:hypothetical protein [Thermoleophilia bacterium]
MQAPWLAVVHPSRSPSTHATTSSGNAFWSVFPLASFTRTVMALPDETVSGVPLSTPVAASIAIHFNSTGVLCRDQE